MYICFIIIIENKKIIKLLKIKLDKKLENRLILINAES